MASDIIKAQLEGEVIVTSPTKRELDIMMLLCGDLSNGEIAHKLGISEQTVKNHLFNLYVKLQVRGRIGAALWYVKHYGVPTEVNIK